MSFNRVENAILMYSLAYSNLSTVHFSFLYVSILRLLIYAYIIYVCDLVCCILFMKNFNGEIEHICFSMG